MVFRSCVLPESWSNVSVISDLQGRLREWTDWFDGDDVHSIQAQVAEMLLRTAFYKSINESRKYLPDDGQGGTIANGLLHELIDDGYVVMHAMVIRRLLDDNKKNSVRSVTRLLRDIAKHAPALTRHNVFAARNLLYDYAPVHELRYQEAAAEARARMERPVFVSGEGWSDSAAWHDIWDRLCGTDDHTRSPSDCPAEARFHKLREDLLRAGESVTAHVDNYIAHAASKAKRRTLPPDCDRLTLQSLWDAERAIVRVVGFISSSVITGVQTGAPSTAFDQFEHMDAPFVVPEALTAVHRAWDRYSEEMDECYCWHWDQPLAPEDT
jgi:hypothetical protein